ncbi:MAG: class I SAM-dependent methyltransferase [Lachnospiraceae bacterium]|nr:class I SAM-dependent methyltransferase [Lachnospiraceae bacterium]
MSETAGHINGWKSIWSKSTVLDDIKLSGEEDFAEVFMELKAFTDPNYHGGYPSLSRFNAFVDQFNIFLRELSFSTDPEYQPKSFFDVGCSTGPYLYYLSTLNPEFRLGGMDYSEAYVEVARRYVQNAVELYSAEARDLKTDIKYDCVFSRSIFQYFDDLAYGEEVITRMIEKADHSVGIFDVHDLAKKEAFLNYRRSVVENYDEKYKDTQHLFYPKSMFIDIAERYDCDVKFAHCALPNYWNAAYTYDVYFYKR